MIGGTITSLDPLAITDRAARGRSDLFAAFAMAGRRA
jgi:hypothetical protein